MDGWLSAAGAFEFAHAGFEPCDVLAQDLSSRLALTVIVLAVCTLLGLGALLETFEMM